MNTTEKEQKQLQKQEQKQERKQQRLEKKERKLEKKRSRQSLKAYLQCYPELLKYQIFAGIALYICFSIVKYVTMMLIHSTGRVAVTSGDFAFIFTSWQGWLVIFITLGSLFMCIAIDVNGLIIMSSKLLNNEKVKIIQVIKEAVASLRLFKNKEGVVIGLYIALCAPLAGFGLMISKTSNFYVPKFISSVIYSNPLYMAGYAVLIVLLLFFGIRNIFLLPYMILEKKEPKDVLKPAHSMIRKGWKSLFKNEIIISVKMAVLAFAFVMLLCMMPFLITDAAGVSQLGQRFVLMMGMFSVWLATLLILSLNAAILTMELTRNFYCLRDEENVVLQRKRGTVLTLRTAILLFIVMIIMVPVSMFFSKNFDVLFATQWNTQLIAHRLGGNAAPENTIEGERIAIRQGADGTETDVQRAKDGVYIINHDKTFERLCGVDKRPQDMTSEEIQQLTITGADGKTAHPALLEEVLDEGKGKIHIYIELKGDTADRQMADDVVQMIRDRNMEKECTIISIKYDLIQYTDKTYPDIETGLLYYFSYGDNASLDCDLLIMEEESASDRSINSIHTLKKKAIVWTINEEESATVVLKSGVDGVITDEIEMCKSVQQQIENREDFEKVLDAIGKIMGT